MSEKDKDSEENKKKGTTAEDVARIMVENMKANMADPDFWNKRERIRKKALDKVLKERKKRENLE